MATLSVSETEINSGVAYAEDLKSRKAAAEIANSASVVNPIKNYGAVVDGTTDDTQSFIDASSDLGANGVVTLTSGDMFIDGSRPRLQDYQVVMSAEDDANLKCELNPDVKELKLLSSLSTSNPTLSRAHRFHQNHNRDWLNALVGANTRSVNPEPYTQELGDFTDWDNYTVTITQSLLAGTATVTTDSVSWAAAFASSQEGVFKSPRLFSTYEVTFSRDDSALGTPDNSYIGATILFGSDRIIVAFREEDATAKVFHINSSGTLTTVANITLPSLAYTITQSGSLTVGIRLVSSTLFEVYSNDILIYKGDVSNFITDNISLVGFTVTPTISGKVSVETPIRSSIRKPVSKRNAQIGIIGDSISYGAWASIDYATFLKRMLESTDFGTVTMRNEAVSGSSARTWVTGGVYGGDGGSTSYSLATQDFSDDHYTVVMLGTNDAIADNDLNQYYDDLKAICDAIADDGSTPIICSFPVTKTAQSGCERMPLYIAEAKKLAIDNGWSFAQNRESFGAKDALYFDSLHPHEVGQVSLAASIHESIVTDESRKIYGNPEAIKSVTLDIDSFANSWSAQSGAEDRKPQIHVKDGRVELSGLITGGSASVTAFTIPYELFDSSRDIFQVISNRSDSIYDSATVYISDSGIVQILGGTLSGATWWVSLDGVGWEI